VKITRLEKEIANINQLIKDEPLTLFKKGYSNAKERYKYHTKLSTLALKEFQKLPKQIKASAPPKFSKAPTERFPNLNHLKINLDHIDSVAIRDNAGNITGYKKPPSYIFEVVLGYNIEQYEKRIDIISRQIFNLRRRS